MDEATAESRRNDAIFQNISEAMKEQSQKLGAMQIEINGVNVLLGKLTVLSEEKIVQLEYRIGELEQWKNAMNRYMIGLVMVVVTAIVMWIVQQFGAAHVLK